MVDFRGPLGWRASSVPLGRADRLGSAPAEGVEASLRVVQPLVELRVAFTLERTELDDIGRGAEDADLDPVMQAAARLAYAEDRLVFHGFQAAGVTGIAPSSPHPAVQPPGGYDTWPAVAAESTRVLRTAGVAGPYAMVLGPACYTGLVQATGRGGCPVLEIVRELVGGPVVWAPAVEGALVVSLRGGDFILTVGQDVSIGYDAHTDRQVHLFLIESLTFRVLAPEAAVPVALSC